MFVCAFCITLHGKARAGELLLDYQVKAAMVYKFLGYSTWPDNRFSGPQSPYRIWVMGSGEIKNELEGIVAQRVINGRSIEIYSAKTVDQIKDAHLVFVSHKREALLPALILQARKDAFIIVTESENGLSNGSTINLRLVDNKIRFEISLQSAKENNITFSSRLLAIAISIKGAQD